MSLFYEYKDFQEGRMVRIPKDNLFGKIASSFHFYRLGLKYKYPKCCIWYFIKLAFMGIPPALFVIRMKGEYTSDYVPCDKCYPKFKKQK